MHVMWFLSAVPGQVQPLFYDEAVLLCDHNASYNTRGGSSFTKSMPDVQNPEYHGLSYSIFKQSR